MYKVFEVATEEGKKYQIFWCPSAPHTYTDKVPYTDRLYPHRQAAYRMCKKLNEGNTRDARVRAKEGIHQ